jgi:hypothetical protein
MAHRLLVISSKAALLGSFFITSPAWAVTPECENDEDCEAGFDCVVIGTSSPGTGGTSGGGSGGSGGAVAICGDSVCSFDESVDACPADCVELRSCEPAECEDSSECAEGYFCAAGTPAGTGGSGPLFCGDGICSTDETVENCAEDCFAPSHCEVEWVSCGSTADCPEGFYCNLPSSGSGSGGVGAASGGGASGSAGASGDGAGGSTGGTASSEFAAPRPEGGSGGLGDPLPGACLPGEGMGGSSGTTGSGGSTGGFGAVSGSAGAVTGGSGPVDGGTGPGGSAGTGAATGSGATGSGATGGATGSGATDSGGTSGSTANGGMSGGDGDPKSGEHGGGCSYSATSKSSPFGLLFGLALLFGRIRRRNARRA